MHMANHLVSPEVGSTMFLVSSVGIGYAIRKIKSDPKQLERADIGLFAATSALVFAAQMVNFSLPMTGSSGHIVGGVLLALLFGRAPSTLAMSVILTLQSLIFADGGLFALGANIFNMAIIPCLIVIPLMQKLIGQSRVMLPIIATLVSIQLGAFSVVVETQASQITTLPFYDFLLRIQPIHLAISLIEAVVTVGLLALIQKIRGKRQAVYMLSGLAFSVGAFVSLLASQLPDGLEWASEKKSSGISLTSQDNFLQAVEKFQTSLAFLPDYSFATIHANEMLGTMLSGILGCALTLFAIACLGLLLLQKSTLLSKT